MSQSTTLKTLWTGVHGSMGPNTPGHADYLADLRKRAISNDCLYTDSDLAPALVNAKQKIPVWAVPTLGDTVAGVWVDTLITNRGGSDLRPCYLVLSLVDGAIITAKTLRIRQEQEGTAA